MSETEKVFVMTMNNKIPTKVKPFFRILKELGLYNKWIKERKKSAKDTLKYYEDTNKPSMTLMEQFYIILNDDFSSNIINGFTWSTAENSLLWEMLYNISQHFENKNCSSILSNEKGELNTLKKEVMNYIKKHEHRHL